MFVINHVAIFRLSNPLDEYLDLLRGRTRIPAIDVHVPVPDGPLRKSKTFISKGLQCDIYYLSLRGDEVAVAISSSIIAKRFQRCFTV